MDASEVLGGMPDDVAMAREYAVLGAYDVALQFYDRALSSVARYMRTIVDTADRNRWSKVSACNRRGHAKRSGLLASRAPVQSGLADCPCGGPPLEGGGRGPSLPFPFAPRSSPTPTGARVLPGPPLRSRAYGPPFFAALSTRRSRRTSAPR